MNGSNGIGVVLRTPSKSPPSSANRPRAESDGCNRQVRISEDFCLHQVAPKNQMPPPLRAMLEHLSYALQLSPFWIDSSIEFPLSFRGGSRACVSTHSVGQLRQNISYLKFNIL